MAQITLRIPDDSLAALDQLVNAGRFTDRSSAVRAAITDLVLAEVYARAYGEQPPTSVDAAGVDEIARAAIAEEPW